MVIQKLEDDRCWFWLASSLQRTFCRKGRLRTGLELAGFLTVRCWILKPVQVTAHFNVFRSLLISRQVFTRCTVNGSIFPDLCQLRRARSLFLVMQSVMRDSLGSLRTSTKVRRWWNFYRTFHDIILWNFRLFSSAFTCIRQNNISSSSSLQQNFIWQNYPLQTHGWGQELLFILWLQLNWADFMHIWYKSVCT